MSQLPAASPKTLGRTFDTDWSIGNVAKLLRSNANRGVWQSSGSTGGSTAAVNQNYLRTVSARHRPSGASVVFLRLQQEQSWYLSLCFVGTGGAYAAWDPAAAEEWMWALFGEDRPRVLESGSQTNVRQFTLPM